MGVLGAGCVQGRLQCIAEETETLDISAALMPEVTKEREAPDHELSLIHI